MRTVEYLNAFHVFSSLQHSVDSSGQARNNGLSPPAQMEWKQSKTHTIHHTIATEFSVDEAIRIQK